MLESPASWPGRSTASAWACLVAWAVSILDHRPFIPGHSASFRPSASDVPTGALRVIQTEIAAALHASSSYISVPVSLKRP